MSEAVATSAHLEEGFVQFFVDAVKVVGLPPSTGQIYGQLFVSREPLALDQLVERLEISKGSASQGLRLLRQIGAVREIEVEGDRRMFYQAEDHLRRLVGGFLREQIRPHMDSGLSKIEELKVAAAEADEAFYEERALRVRKWLTRSRRLLPFIQKVLGE